MSVEGSSTIITGTLGGGKSMCAVDMAMEHLSLGGTVVTNIPIFSDKVASWMLEEFGLIFDPTRLILLNQASIADFENHAVRGNQKIAAMMVLDEAALDLNAKDHAQVSRETFNFVVLVRKLRIHLVFIAQDANDVAKQIRGKMQKEIHCRSLMNFWEGIRIPLFVRVPYTLEVGKKPWRRKAKWSWKARSWGFFDSHALHGAKATIYGALQEAASSDLQRRQYDVKPYYAALATSSLAAALICLLAS
ncbi:zonular occludens toxin domain-containing protein [Oleiharenicola lentus]|uniref:zonular occludens toxin domain-containing protein n=1 Tax=Oleiharenicola lentus TaxID=2508720 RepID=UPI003F676BC5